MNVSAGAAKASTPVARLDVAHARKSFGGVEALRDASLRVAAGEVVALVGDNGAGKSTLVKAISGVLRLDGGSVAVDGLEQYFRSPKDATRAGVQTVYQDLALVPNLNVIQNLFLGREICVKRGSWFVRRPDDIRMEVEATQFLSGLGLTTIADVRSPVGRMSGGQRQTVAIARSIFNNSKVLILDEPTAALGVHESRHILDLVGRLKGSDLSILLISHNLQEIFEIADRIVVLRLGSTEREFERKHTSHQEVVAAIMGAGV